jgi:hypothetical protein
MPAKPAKSVKTFFQFSPAHFTRRVIWSHDQMDWVEDQGDGDYRLVRFHDVKGGGRTCLPKNFPYVGATASTMAGLKKLALTIFKAKTAVLCDRMSGPSWENLQGMYLEYEFAGTPDVLGHRPPCAAKLVDVQVESRLWKLSAPKVVPQGDGQVLESELLTKRRYSYTYTWEGKTHKVTTNWIQGRRITLALSARELEE